MLSGSPPNPLWHRENLDPPGVNDDILAGREKRNEHGQHCHEHKMVLRIL